MLRFENIATGSPSSTELFFEFYPVDPLTGITQAHISLHSDFSFRQEYTLAANATFKTFTGLVPAMYYYVRVRNIDENNVASDWQGVGQETQQIDGYSNEAPRAPINFSGNFSTLNFGWSQGLEGYPEAESFVMQLSKSSNFASPIVISGIPANALSYHVLLTLIPSTRYYSRLAGVNLYGYSPWSQAVTGVTAPVGQLAGTSVQGSLTSNVGDFLRDENGALIIQNGDLVIGDATKQHQKDIVVADKAWNHFYPLLGVGLQKFLNDTEGLIGLRQAIRYELERDGQFVEKVELQKGQIQIEATYD